MERRQRIFADDASSTLTVASSPVGSALGQQTCLWTKEGEMEFKRRLFLGLGLTVALVLAMSPATASAVSTLTGEHLSAPAEVFPSICNASADFSYTVSGTATGPYPGTFTETGLGTSGLPSGLFPGPATLSASFTIHSGNFLITGTKSGGTGLGCHGEFGDSFVQVSGLSYQATIHTSTGNYADQGTSDALVQNSPFAGINLAEDFTSSLTEPVLITPTNKNQCKNNGWKNFPEFKHQGQCVSFVERQGQN
jgi:hypothetical protein